MSAHVHSMLVLDGLSKHFGAVRAVDSVSVKIPSGQVVGIIGRSGAGKSTLLRLINRLLEPTGGRIVWKGADIIALRGHALRRWRSRCAMIFQQFNLVPRLDVLTNVLVGRLGYRATLPSLLGTFSAEERARAVWALYRLDLVPQALQRADTLSGGQQQRVAIARALVQEPEILLADEPVASLDPANTARVMEALLAINRQDGITVICTLHALEVARRYCDRVLGFAGGALVFDGHPGDLDAERARAVYGTDAEEGMAATAVPEEIAR